MGILEADNTKQTKINEKVMKRGLQKNKMIPQSQDLQKKSVQMFKHLSSPPWKIL